MHASVCVCVEVREENKTTTNVCYYRTSSREVMQLINLQPFFRRFKK